MTPFALEESLSVIYVESMEAVCQPTDARGLTLYAAPIDVFPQCFGGATGPRRIKRHGLSQLDGERRFFEKP